MENASELEAPRTSIQTKDLIRYNNHTTCYNKNHSNFIQKSQQHSTAKCLTSHSRQTTQTNIHAQTSEQPPSPAVLKNQPVRRPYFNKKRTAMNLKSTTVLHSFSKSLSKSLSHQSNNSFLQLLRIVHDAVFILQVLGSTFAYGDQKRARTARRIIYFDFLGRL